jgi:hypothetical protein
MVLSYDALARRRPEDAWVGPNAASAETLPACPTSSVAAAPVAASQRRILESIPPVAGRPSAQCATHVTHSRWPTRAPYSVRRARGFGVGLGGFVGAPPGSLACPGGISSSYAAWSVPPTTKRLASAGERDADVSGRSLTRTVSPAGAIGPACQARATRAGGARRSRRAGGRRGFARRGDDGIREDARRTVVVHPKSAETLVHQGEIRVVREVRRRGGVARERGRGAAAREVGASGEPGGRARGSANERRGGGGRDRNETGGDETREGGADRDRVRTSRPRPRSARAGANATPSAARERRACRPSGASGETRARGAPPSEDQI